MPAPANDIIHTIYRYTSLILFFTGIIACSGDRQQVQETKVLPVQKKLDPADSIFKSWLTDTLKVLGSYDLKRYPNVTYNVSSDSLQLDIYEGYEFVYGKNYQKLDGVGMVSLLKEYAEMPPLHSAISYTAHTNYYPSVVEQLRAAFVYEVEHFQVETKDELIEYGCIRGRLSDKIVKDKKTGNRKEHYAFIWRDDKLIKENRMAYGK